MAKTFLWDDLELFPSLLLLKQVHVRFSTALQDARRQNHIVFFKSTLIQLAWALDWVDYSKEPPNAWPKALPRRLKRTLNELEGLVLDDIRHQEHLTRGTRYNKKLRILVELPKSESSQFFDFEQLEDNFVQSDVKDAIDNCIESLGSIWMPPSLDSEFGLFYSKEDLKRRELCAQYWSELYDQLSGHSSRCHAENSRSHHRVKVVLETLGPSAPKLHLLISTCDDRASHLPIEWQSAIFEREQTKHIQNSSRSSTIVAQSAQRSPEVDWCTQRQTSHQQREYRSRPMRFTYNHVDLRTMRRSQSPHSEHRRFPRYASKSNLTELSVSLGQPASHEPKYMQCLLAHSLWLLYRTPWASGLDFLQGLSLIVAPEQGRSKEENNRVHVAQSPLWTLDDPQQIDTVFMERFGLLLLQIECPSYLEKIFPGDETMIEDGELVEQLIDMEYDNSIQERLHVSREWVRVLMTCLTWDPGNDIEATYILENIFNPLQQELREQEFRKFAHGLLPFKVSEEKPCAVQTCGSKVSTKARSPGARMYDELLEGDSSHTVFAEEYLRKWEVFQKYHSRMASRNPRVKVAVLDTGYCKNDLRGEIDHIKRERRHKRDSPIQDQRNFTPGGAEDTCGHGTRVLQLLLQAAPDADYYIAKISEGVDDGSESTVDSVISALKWAVEKRVDVVNMSFGFSDHSTAELRAAITAAHKAGLKLFAAAGNDGQNVSSVAFPANAPEVFAVFASDGRGDWAGSINPPSGSLPRWNTLGRCVPFRADGETTCLSGTSYATPLVAGLIASTLHYLRAYRDRETTSHEDRLTLARFEEYHGVETILRLTSGEPAKYVAPWKLWKDGRSEEQVITLLLSGLSG